MGRHFIIFIHGVNVRADHNDLDNQRFPSLFGHVSDFNYADELFMKIAIQAGARLDIRKVPLYWGSVNDPQENHLRDLLHESEIWKHVWFKNFREANIVDYIGDATLYISRLVGAQVVAELLAQASDGLARAHDGDSLHLVTHSWGTVILFDILFSSRWDYPMIRGQEVLPGYEEVKTIRNLIFGLGEHRGEGLRLASITTMGSPLALFSLMGINSNATLIQSGHDISYKLHTMLSYLTRSTNTKLPWNNFIHPGDPIAFPVNKVISALVDPHGEYLNIEDWLVTDAGPGALSGLVDKLPFNLDLANLLASGAAHESYWSSDNVARIIAQTIAGMRSQNPAA